MAAADTRRTAQAAEQPSARILLPGAWKLGAGILTAETAVGYLSPALGAVLAAADILIPLAIALILLAAILRGSEQTCERAFRLLRWIAARPEPPAPRAGKPGKTARSARRNSRGTRPGRDLELRKPDTVRRRAGLPAR